VGVVTFHEFKMVSNGLQIELPACSRIFNRFGNATKTTTMYYLLYALSISAT